MPRQRQLDLLSKASERPAEKVLWQGLGLFTFAHLSLVCMHPISEAS